MRNIAEKNKHPSINRLYLGRRFIGLIILIFSVLTLFTILSGAPLVNNLNTAGFSSKNYLGGVSGAILADILLQSFGWASFIALTLSITLGAIWIFRGYFSTDRGILWAKTFIGLFAVIFFAGAVSALPVPALWPYATGLGGLIGDGVFFTFQALFRFLHLPGAPLACILFSLLFSISGLFFCFGLNWQHLIEMTRALQKFLQLIKQMALSLFQRINHWIYKFRRKELQQGPFLSKTSIKPPAVGTKNRKKRSLKNKSKKASPVFATTKASPQPSLKTSSGFILPPIDFLKKNRGHGVSIDVNTQRLNAKRLVDVLTDFGVQGEMRGVQAGPVVTLYEFEPAAGVKSSRIISLADDIARSMSAISARVAVVPGRNALGIELPNPKRDIVFLRDLLSAEAYKETEIDLPLALGASIEGEPIIVDLTRMPHLLIAGTTGSGKSVGVNAMILSLIYKLPPDKCKFIMIDPKMLELSVYDGIPHLLSPVVTDPKKAVVALKWTASEMEARYRKMSKLGVRNIAGYNTRILTAQKTGEKLERKVQTGYDKETGEPAFETEDLMGEPMPFIVVIIDEMADLMIVAGKEIEGTIQRLAQMARAAGIHLIMATQRPSVDVITGTIKANFPTRISFQVTSKIDSRTILGEQGAEQLLGQGDMLYMAGGGRIRRLHGAFLTDAEVEKVTHHLKKQGKPDYLEEITREVDDEESEAKTSSGDELFDRAIEIVARDRKASTSYIQRRLQIGYNRAANLIEQMEEQGMIGPAGHGGKREIFLPKH